MKLKFLSPKGFSLIEMVVAIAIIAVITGLGMPSFISFNRRQSVKAAIAQIRDDSKRIQKLSLSGDKRCKCGVTPTDVDYQLHSWYMLINLTDREHYTLDSKCIQRTDVQTYVCATGPKDSSDPKVIKLKSATNFDSTIRLETLSGNDYILTATVTELYLAFSPTSNNVRFLGNISTETPDYQTNPWFAERAVIKLQDKNDANISYKLVITKTGNIYELE